MRNEHTICGDEMGLGKVKKPNLYEIDTNKHRIVQTINGLALCVVNRLLELAWQEVYESWNNKDGKHLPDETSAKSLPPNLQCPSRFTSLEDISRVELVELAKSCQPLSHDIRIP